MNFPDGVLVTPPKKLRVSQRGLGPTGVIMDWRSEIEEILARRDRLAIAAWYRGHTQEEVGDGLGVSHTMISNILAGRREKIRSTPQLKRRTR